MLQGSLHFLEVTNLRSHQQVEAVVGDEKDRDI